MSKVIFREMNGSIIRSIFNNSILIGVGNSVGSAKLTDFGSMPIKNFLIVNNDNAELEITPELLKDDFKEVLVEVYGVDSPKYFVLTQQFK